MIAVLDSPYRGARKLLAAIDKEDLERVTELLENGVDPNVTRFPYSGFWGHVNFFFQRYNRLPLSEACEVGNYELVKLLIDYGANVNPAVEKMKVSTPLKAATIGYHPDDLKIIELLIKNGADISKMQGNSTAVQTAVAYMKVYCPQFTAKELKQKDNQKIVQQFASQSPEARAENITKIVQRLIGDQSPNLALLGRTMLMSAASNGNQPLCNYLLSIGADKTLTDSNGKTAYDYAVENGYTELAELLKP